METTVAADADCECRPRGLLHLILTTECFRCKENICELLVITALSQLKIGHFVVIRSFNAQNFAGSP
jgi:hypothetical protein